MDKEMEQEMSMHNVYLSFLTAASVLSIDELSDDDLKDYKDYCERELGNVKLELKKRHCEPESIHLPRL